MPNLTVAIVTGASQGIGRATAIRLSHDFSSIVLVARNAVNLDETAGIVRSNGSRALVLDIDLSDSASADIIVTRTIEEFGRIDAVVNIAGAVPPIDLFDMTDEQWDHSFALKFHGARRLTLRAWEALRASHGAVIFTSGTSGVAPKAAVAAVASVNAAIVALSKAFSDRGIADGVQVNSVLPGPVMTARRHMLIETWASAHNSTVEKALKTFPAEVGIGRFGEPEEISELMAFLLSPKARWMTGTAVRMDGGEIKSV